MEVVWENDTRYPGPTIHPLPPFIHGTPTQAELDAQPRLFTWGELKEIIQTRELQHLSRNKELQARYLKWMGGQKEMWGSTENYLANVRLPWAPQRHPVPEPTYDQRTTMSHPEVDLTPSTNPRPAAHASHTRQVSGSAAVAAHALGVLASTPQASTPGQASHVATAASSEPGSGASTPSSVAYVSLDAARLRRELSKSKKARKTGLDSSPPSLLASPMSQALSSPEDLPLDDEVDPLDVFLKYDASRGLDREKYAVLANDWPYNVPYGVRHYCVWSRVPIAHPVLVDYDSDKWAKVETEGLAGFTGVVPVLPDSPPSSPVAGTGAGNLPTPPAEAEGRAGPAECGKGGWYAVDVSYGGKEMRRWAGVQYESVGGHEVGKMVRGLWDERGWETIWFVNPPRLQSVPGFSHFHVFARRKTPGEIDVSEKTMTGVIPAEVPVAVPEIVADLTVAS